MNATDSAFEIDIPGVGPASVVLETIFSLCERLNKTNPSPGLLLDEFITVWNELKRLKTEENRSAPGDVVTAFTDALAAFLVVMQPYEIEPDGESQHSHVDLKRACDNGHVVMQTLCRHLGLPCSVIQFSQPSKTPTNVQPVFHPPTRVYPPPTSQRPRIPRSYYFGPLPKATFSQSKMRLYTPPPSHPPMSKRLYLQSLGNSSSPTSPSVQATLASVQNNIIQLQCFQASVQLTIGRLEVIHRALTNRDVGTTTLSHSEDVEGFHQSLSALVSLLAPRRPLSSVDRELHYGRLNSTIRAANATLDTLSQSLAITTTHATEPWSRQLEEDAAEHHKKMQQLLQRSDEFWNAMRDRKWQYCTMLQLAAELDKMGKNESQQPRQVQEFIREVFLTVWTNSSKTTVPVVPHWFVTEDEITYKLEPLGCGSFGPVHRGNYNGRDVVVQFLNDLDIGVTRAVEKEINVCVSLDSPHVVRLIAACHASNRPFIVSEDVGNTTLADYLRRPGHVHRMWKCFYEAALGLRHLHSKNVVHGEVRLKNLLVGDDDRVRVSECGFVHVKAAARRNASNFAGGTAMETNVPWLAPERFFRMPNYASDVYSLGMTIIEAARGDTPYSPDKPARLADDGRALVKQMTATDPGNRITLQEAIEELARLAEREARTPY